MRILFGSLVGALISATTLPAFSADMLVGSSPIEVSPVSAASTGFYFGAHLGPGIVGVEYDPDFDPAQVQQFSASTLTGGLTLGWDTLLGSNIVAGAELRYDLFGTVFTPYEDAIGGDLFRFHDTISATGKLGYMVAPGTQVYGVVGLGSAGIEAPEGFDGFVSDRVLGLVAGIGAETRITDLISANVDARYFRSLDTFTTEDEVSFLPRYLAVTAGLKFRLDDGLETVAVDSQPIDFDFTGPSVSVSALATAGSMERDIFTPGADVGPFWSEGVGIGVGLGYDFEVGNGWVIGATANLDYVPLVFEDADGNSPDVAATTEFATVDAIASLGVRAGAKLNTSTLLYGKLAVAGINATANDDFFALSGGGNEFLLGYQVGIGIETAISDAVTIGVEGTYTAAIDDLTTENTQLGQVDLRPTLLSGKMTLKYHF